VGASAGHGVNGEPGGLVGSACAQETLHECFFRDQLFFRLILHHALQREETWQLAGGWAVVLALLSI
jgi:hypothetical protein